MGGFLASEGFHLRRLVLDEEMRRSFVGDAVPVARGEHLAVAET